MQKSTNYFLELGKQLLKQKLKDTLIQNSGSFVRIKTSVTAFPSVYSGNTNIILQHCCIIKTRKKVAEILLEDIEKLEGINMNPCKYQP